MANRLKMAKVQSILSLHSQGWSRRRIARELCVDRETVSRYVAARSAIARRSRARWRHFKTRQCADFGPRVTGVRWNHQLRRSSRPAPAAAATASRGAR